LSLCSSESTYDTVCAANHTLYRQKKDKELDRIWREGEGKREKEREYDEVVRLLARWHGVRQSSHPLHARRKYPAALCKVLWKNKSRKRKKGMMQEEQRLYR
jgi:hypothetical protein